MRCLLRALKAGSESPLLVTIPGKTFPNSWSVSLLGALNELYLVSVAESYITCADLSCIGFNYNNCFGKVMSTRYFGDRSMHEKVLLLN